MLKWTTNERMNGECHILSDGDLDLLIYFISADYVYACDIALHLFEFALRIVHQ